MDTETRIVRAVEQHGPLTGAELLAALPPAGAAAPRRRPAYAFDCWRATMRSSRVAVERVGTRFLRLDRRVEGFARLSPSILREFLTYSVVGLAGDAAARERRAAEVLAHTRAVSRAKMDLAAGVVAGIAGRVTADAGAAGGTAPGAVAGAAGPVAPFCVFIAGDVVYGMAHDVARPERSTGRMVRGSDLDLVVVVDDAAPEALLQRLDDAVYRQKYRHLINPSAREEIDYVVKRFARLREQAAFDGFKEMIACKILQEGVFLHGDRRLFDAAKALLREYGVTEKLAAMEADAARSRREAELQLLDRAESGLGDDEMQLFYPAEESEEFE